MNIRENIGQRIRKARKGLGLSMRALAEKTKTLQQSRINNWERGIRLPGPVEAQELAQALGISASYLLCLTDDPHASETALLKQAPRIVPILNFENAENVTTLINPDHKETLENLRKFEHVPLSDSLKKQAGPFTFAIKLEDESMLPDFQSGDLIIIDPDTAPQPGKFVLVKIQNKPKPLFRKYREKQEDTEIKIELVPSNHDWPTIAFNEDKKNKIIGTMVELRRPG